MNLKELNGVPPIMFLLQAHVAGEQSLRHLDCKIAVVAEFVAFLEERAQTGESHYSLLERPIVAGKGMFIPHPMHREPVAELLDGPFSLILEELIPKLAGCDEPFECLPVAVHKIENGPNHAVPRLTP